MLRLKLKSDADADSHENQKSPSNPPVETPQKQSTPSSGGGIRLSLSLGANNTSTIDNEPDTSVQKGAEPASDKPLRIRVKTNKQLIEGYDAEAPDREEDPTIEEAIILRMMPGVPALDTLRSACDNNDFSKLQIQFDDRRNAIVTIDGEQFNAILVDLPTVTEVQKTFDRKNIYKTTDVSQMLLVTNKVGSQPAKNPDVEKAINSDDYQWPHGITPPLHNARSRRFHRRLSNKVIESLEAQVEELLQRDREAQEVQTELVPASAVAAQHALATAEIERKRRADKKAADQIGQEEEAESDEELDDLLGMELEKALDDEDNGDEKHADSGTPRSAHGANGGEEEDMDDDDDDDDDDGDDDDDDELNDDQKDARQQNKQLRQEIKELQATIESKERVAETFINHIMRQRHMEAVNRLRSELEVKRGLLEDAEDEEALEQEESNQAQAAAAAQAKALEYEVDEEDEEEEIDDEEDDAEEEADQPMPDVPAEGDDLDDLF